ncbi:MAG: hypothetical protein JWL81_587 [Verrucomicrobiales bacterium]|nr:hypothetical protein [Verrucomicrobiales bacterium]
MRSHFILSSLLLVSLACVPACHQVRQVGHGLSTGTGYVSRPVVAGSKKLASATMTGSRAVAEATANSSRAVAGATLAGGRKIASATTTGAKALAAGATRLITFGSANRAPAPAPLAQSPPTDRKEPGLPPAHVFPKTGLLVTEAELGPDATRLETTAVTLAGGWVLNGENLAYRLDPGADDPAALRVKGSPATAKLADPADPTSITTATAREIHYHSGNQVLTLRGGAILSSAGTTVSATAPGTLIKIHLPTGAISIDGPARWGS